MLTKTAADFNPALSFLNEAGNALAGAELQLGGKSVRHVAISVTIPQDGRYYLTVNDFASKGDASFTYVATVFVDEDLDGIDDAYEEALGINKTKDDSDADGIIDFVEAWSLATIDLDVDQDGIPAWLDSDSDGDGIGDQLESSFDIDQDGMPSFLDLDADGNGVSDSEEAGDPSNLLDTDGDSVPDFLDLDDDADGLVDLIDDSRLEPLEVSDETDEGSRLIIDRLEFRDQNLYVNNVAPAETEVRIYGRGFSQTLEENVVIVETANGLVNITPTVVAEDYLIIVLPESVGEKIFVISDGRRSNELLVDVVPANAPILYLLEQKEYLRGETLTLNGRNFTDSMNVNFGGVSVAASFESSSVASVVIPASGEFNEISVITANGESNKVALSIQQNANVNVVLPANSSVGYAELQISSSVVGEVAVNSEGQALIQTEELTLDYVSVLRTIAQTEYLFLQAVSVPGITLTNIDSLSTAVAMTMLATPEIAQLSVEEIASNWGALQQSTSMQAFAALLEAKLAANPEYLQSVDAEYFEALNNAIAEAKDIMLPATANRVAPMAAPISGPVVTPEQHDVKVFAIEEGIFDTVYTGDIGVENDTQLFLSTRIVNRKTGDELYSHITSYFDVNLVGPQGLGILFNASSKTNYQQCNFVDCDVEIVSPGFNPLAGNQGVAQILAAKTMIERIVYPLFEYVLDLEIKPSDATKILVNAAPSVVNAVGSQAANGNVSDAAKTLINHIYDDFRTPPTGGPITQALVKRFGGNLTQELQEKLAKKLAAKGIPIFGQISGALDALGAIGTGWGVSKAVYDLGASPGDINFEVVWPMEVVELLPKAVSIDEGPQSVILKGQGLDKVEAVRLVDRGVGGQAPIELSPGALSEDHKALSILITEDYISDAVGPIDVYIENAEESKIAAEQLEVVADLTIIELVEDKGVAGDVVEIHGAGFHPIRSYNQVTFQGEGSRRTATVISADRHLLTVRVPTGAITGDVRVQVEDQVSNDLQFEVEAGNVIINFGDNGAVNDDTYGLYVDSNLIHAMPAPTRSAGPFSLDLEPGIHHITLRGITAPDDIGTYFISFSGDVVNVEGSALSGEDLTAGVEKHWTIEVGTPSSALMPMAVPMSTIRWAE